MYPSVEELLKGIWQNQEDDVKYSQVHNICY